MAVYALGDRVPDIHPDAYVHPDATVIGAVTIRAHASVWPHAVLRGDYGSISIGARTSVQDGSVLHATDVDHTVVGEECVIGHLVHLEGCVIEPQSLVGNGATVLAGAVVRHGAIVGSGAVVPHGMEVPSGAMALGVPARLRLDAVPPGAAALGVAVYVENAARYRTDLRRLS